MHLKLIEQVDWGGAGVAAEGELLQLQGEHGPDCWRATWNGRSVVVPRSMCVLLDGPPPATETPTNA